MSYLAILTFLLLLSGFSFAQDSNSSLVTYPTCNSTLVQGKHAPLGWVRPSDLLVQTFFDSYRIIQTINSHKQDPCYLAAYMLATCNNDSRSFPLVFATLVSSYLVAYQIPTDSPYLFYTPTGSSPCKCSGIVYSLLAACSACRGGHWLTYVSSNHSNSSLEFTFAQSVISFPQYSSGCPQQSPNDPP
jgi:hypothetical protein